MKRPAAAGTASCARSVKQAGLRVRIGDIDALHRCYMPFLRHGGLFVPDETRFAPGVELAIVLQLPHETAPEQVRARVVWLSPGDSQRGTPSGCGFAFSAEDEAVRARIENLLAAKPPDSDRYTL